MTDNIFQQAAGMTKLESVSRESGLDIPVESVTLPSQGLIYPIGHALSNEKALEIKCMSAREEDLLTSRALFKNGTVLTKLLQACILNKSVDPDDMIIGDRNAVLIGIRITGYGSEYKVKLSCPDCSKEYDQTFSLGELKLKTLSVSPVAENTNLFSFQFPICKKKVNFKLLNGRDEDEISKYVEAQKKLDIQIDHTMTLRLLQSIVSIDGESDKGKLSSMINNLRAGDARALRKYIADISPSVDMKQKTICKFCSTESEVEVPLGLTFFWPDLDN